MKNDRTASDLAEDGSDLYPHLKINSEPYPRVLATRRIEDDEAEYFGAFLTKTSVRILIDFLNRTFRLRTCDIPIDGTFPVPCTQYYHRRCIAPCVTSLCSPIEYKEMTDLVRMFLGDRRGDLNAALRQKMTRSSDDLNFERAASWRDILTAVEEYWQSPRSNVWLDDTVDTFDADETAAGSFIYLVTQRGRNVLGRKVFRLPKGGGLLPDEAMGRIVGSFYRFHLPREIRVSIDFEGRQRLTHRLSDQFGRPARIVVTAPDRRRVTAARALRSAWSENELEFVKAKASARQISGELKRSFGLSALPRRVEAFDVAHISGVYFVGASTVWQDGAFLPEQHRFYISDEKSEPAAMSEAVLMRLTDDRVTPPDLILIDGGRTQVNAALASIRLNRGIGLIGAIKPPGQHTSVSRFITAAGEEVEYESDNPAHNMLKLLRDAAHDLANRVHRDLREMGHYYELAAMLPSLNEQERRRVVAASGSVVKLLAADDLHLSDILDADLANRTGSDIQRYRTAPPQTILPLIVPIRYVSEDGDAEDLRPISSK